MIGQAQFLSWPHDDRGHGSTVTDADILIIGAGISGAALAWQLAGARRVVVLEGERTPSHHSTGRSAAMQTVYAGKPMIQAASRASEAFLAQPPEGFADVPLLTPRGVLRLADAAGRAALAAAHDAALAQGRPVTLLTRAQMLARGYPVAERVVLGLLDAAPSDIDVDALHQGFLRGAQRKGAQIRLGQKVTGMKRAHGRWWIMAGQEALTADVVVNAAGAFSDEVAAMAGAEPIRVTPKRRTIAVVPTPEGMPAADWPLMADADFSFYMKPEASGLLVSPSDAEPQAAGDAHPEELDVAIAIDRMQQWLDIPVRRVSHSWAGLRSFAEDEDPLIGFDSRAEGFFWYAGQGGFGVQSAPALSCAAAHILLGKALPEHLRRAGLSPERLCPDRLIKEVT